MERFLLKDLLKYMPSFVVPALAGFLSVPLITHHLPPAEYGNYMLITALISAVTAIGISWIGSAVLRFLPACKNELQRENLYRSSFSLMLFCQLFVIALSLLIILLLNKFISPQITGLAVFGVIAFSTTSAASLLTQILRAKGKSGTFSLYAALKSILSLGIGLLLIVYAKNGAEGLLAGVSLGSASILPFLYRSAFRGVRLKVINPFSKDSKKFFLYGFLLMIAGVTSWVLSASDRLILGVSKGTEEVGIYSASYMLTEQAIGVILTLFLLSCNPLALKIWEEEGAKKTGEFNTVSARFFLLFAIPAVFGISVTAEQAVSVFTPDQYFEGRAVIPVIACGLFFAGLCNRYAVGLLCAKRTDILMYSSLGAALLNVLLNLLFVPKFGFMAAAVSTSLSYLFNLLAVALLSKRYLKWHFPVSTLMKVFISSLLMVAAVKLSPALIQHNAAGLFFTITFGAAVYTGFLILFREINIKDLKQLSLLTKKERKA